MAKHQFEKVFTVEEANALIPRMEILVRGLQVEADALRARIRELARRHDSSIAAMPLSDLIERYPELKENAARMAEMAGQVEGLGCFLKDIDQGLVDFPFEIEDDVVFCAGNPASARSSPGIQSIPVSPTAGRYPALTSRI